MKAALTNYMSGLASAGLDAMRGAKHMGNLLDFNIGIFNGLSYNFYTPAKKQKYTHIYPFTLLSL